MATKRKAPQVAGPRVIADAGPLIALARCGHLGILKRLFGRVWITREVAAELQLGTSAPGAAALDKAISDGWLAVLPGLVRVEPHPFLDLGEASCLAAAAGEALLLMDERLGRREAARLGLRVAGTAGLLCTAKARGHIKAVLPILEKMRAEGYFLGDAVLASARRQAGE